MRRYRTWAALALAVAAASPASAQKFVSDSYNFLKAVRDRDGTKVQEYLDQPGNAFLATREDGTGETALIIAVKRRDSPYTQVFLSRGADVNARDGQGATALADAAQIGWVEGAQLLLNSGARVDLANDRGETPLILATQTRDLAMVRALIDAGADPHIADSASGMTAIDYAKRDSRSQIVLKALEDAKPKPKRAVAGPTQ